MEEGTVDVELFDDRLAGFMANTAEFDHMDGQALELISMVSGLPGDTYTDRECLWIIHKLVNKWSELAD
jgi:hypothetical protein